MTKARVNFLATIPKKLQTCDPVTYFASLAVRCLSRTFVPKVRPSMSSVAVAKTFPALTRAAQLASASHGACKRALETFCHGEVSVCVCAIAISDRDSPLVDKVGGRTFFKGPFSKWPTRFVFLAMGLPDFFVNVKRVKHISRYRSRWATCTFSVHHICSHPKVKLCSLD